MLTRVAHVTIRYRWAVIGCWLVLVVVGGFAAGKVSTRWYQSFSVPGQSAYQAGQRTLATFGAGVRPPSVVVFHTAGDATKSRAIAQAMRRAAATMPGSLSSSYFSTHNPAYVSRDRHTTFMELYPPGPGTLTTDSRAVAVRAAAASGLPAGVTVDVTGHDPLQEASAHGSSGGSSVLVDALVGGLGALVILLFVFGTLPAVLLNLVSLAAAFGILVFVFQQGHGSAIWGIGATQSIAPWLPVMIFAFLYGLSMDYEVFMLARIREAYDQTGSTHKAIELGLARTGKLVTSGAFILMFAFLLLSTSPGYLSKEFAIALAGGIIFDATVIRALLVPALMRLLGNANWWMPSWTRTILLLRRPIGQPGLRPELAGRKA